MSDECEAMPSGGVPFVARAVQDLTWGLFAGVDTVEYTNKPMPDTTVVFVSRLLAESSPLQVLRSVQSEGLGKGAMLTASRQRII